LERIKAGFPRMETALANFSILMGIAKGFSWSAKVSKGRFIVEISGAPKGMEWKERWASWLAAEALGQADPDLRKSKAFGGITGVDGLSLPIEEIKPADFPEIIDPSNAGIPHEGLRAGARRLLKRGGRLPLQAVAGLRAPMPADAEVLLFSRFSQALFLDPWTAGMVRLPGRSPAVRVAVRPMPVTPLLPAAYALAVRALFRCSLI